MAKLFVVSLSQHSEGIIAAADEKEARDLIRDFAHDIIDNMTDYDVDYVDELNNEKQVSSDDLDYEPLNPWAFKDDPELEGLTVGEILAVLKERRRKAEIEAKVEAASGNLFEWAAKNKAETVS